MIPTISSWLKRMGVFFLILAHIFSWDVVPAYAQTSIVFAGRTWIVKSGINGPGNNYWNDSSNAVFVDAQGRLHLKIISVNGIWYSSEVYLPSSLGYGTYQFDIDSSISTIDQNVVVAPFLYQDDGHEIDIEFTNWRSPGEWMGHYSVQPGTIAGNTTLFPTPTGASPSTHRIQWTPTQTGFTSNVSGTTLNKWTYTGPNNFVPGSEVAHINNWLIDGLPPSNGQEQELIIKNFTFTPPSIAPTTTVKKVRRRR